MNLALNAVVTANRSYANSRPEQAVNGVRHTDDNWAPYASDGGNGGWDSGSDAEDAILEVDFLVERTFRHIRVATLGDDVNYDDNPTIYDTFTLYGNTSYEIDYWNGVAWVNIVTVTGNDRILRTHTFPAIKASKVRFVGLGTADHPSTPHARLVEFEVWSDDPRYDPMGELEALQKSIIENQWPNGLPTNGATSYTADGGPSAAFDLNGDSDLLTFNVLSGLTLNGYVFTPVATPPVGGVVRDAWVINLLGHETVADGIDRVQYFVDRGFRTILLGMPNFEPNSSSWNYTRATPPGTVSITGATHAQYASVIEADGTPILPLFLDQIFRAANWIRESDPDAVIHLTGHSGGGFMCAMAAALDNDQYFTVKNANAGENPFHLDDTVVHVEQSSARPWWNGHDWDDLYPIAARYGKFTKSHNEQDDFFSAYQRYHIFREMVDDVRAVVAANDYSGEFNIYIDPAQITHDYSETSLQKFVDDCIVAEPTFTPLNPTSIAWAAYLASAYSTTDGATVSDWNDSTANNRDATVIGTPKWRAVYLNGLPVLEMSGDSNDGFTIPDMSGLTEVSSIEISRTDAPAANGGSDLGTDAVNPAHWPYNADPGLFIYDPFGSTARKGPIIPQSDLTEWGVHYWWSKASDWGLMNDWKVAHTTATNTVGCSAAPTLWRNITPASQVGHLAARWIFSAKLTDDQRLRIKAWIEATYGLDAD